MDNRLLIVLLSLFSFWLLFNYSLVEGLTPEKPKPKTGIGSDAWEKMSDEEGKKLTQLSQNSQLIKNRKTGKIRKATPEEIKKREQAEIEMRHQQKNAEQIIAQAKQNAHKDIGKGELDPNKKKPQASKETPQEPVGAGSELADHKTESSQCAKYVKHINKLYDIIPCKKRCTTIYSDDSKFIGHDCKNQECRCIFHDSGEKVGKNSLENFYRHHGKCDSHQLLKGIA